ncbi:hypothetical protein L6452_38753 [Arctium lappa]|uniref:Uncharacterized protein n=1 Tax=Arctium lappa TaxID=4217 RepID=A0ACB8XQZ5_ARCLA|nr:hypothetical protein L6452_38753 [Arctium lappa]
MVDISETPTDTTEYADWAHSLEGCLFRFSLSVLNLSNVDYELDKLLVFEMKLKIPKNFFVPSGLLGDRGSLTLTFTGPMATLELWRSSSEFCAISKEDLVSTTLTQLTAAETMAYGNLMKMSTGLFP